jgi:6-phospho-beta-glucosidase
MKLSILGGGGFRTPYIYEALLHDSGSPRVEEVALYDVDETRLRAMTAILTELAGGHADAPRILSTTGLETAVAGSAFVFAALRVGGLEGRRHDEHVALELDTLGQETTGPGGIAYAFRTVPVMVRAAEVIKQFAPDAYVMNFTNPAGIITEAMQSVLGDRVMGICDTPTGLGRRVADLLGVDHRRLQLDYVGLNHLGWTRRVIHDGRDVLPQLLASDNLLAALEEGHVFGAEWLRTMGAIPNEYLYYYYFNRDAIAAIQSSGATRGDFLAQTQGAFYERVSHAETGVADTWREAVARRSASYMAEAKGGTQGNPTHASGAPVETGHQGYAGVALDVLAAICRNEPRTVILNVRNGGVIAGLPDDAVVEVPALVDSNGVRALATSQPDLHQLGLMAQVKSVERHAIRAALTGSKGEALKALALHPLVDSVEVARKLLDGYIAGIPEVAAVLNHD